MENKIRIAGTEFSLKFKSFEIYVQGCDRHCPGCHNPESQCFDGGVEEDIDLFLARQARKVEAFDSFVDKIYVTGGDILTLPDVFLAEYFCRKVRMKWPDKEVWLFTGAEPKDLPKWVWKYFNVIKTGRYKQEFKQEGFPATSNQKLLFNSKLLKQSEVEEFNNIKFRGEKYWI